MLRTRRTSRKKSSGERHASEATPKLHRIRILSGVCLKATDIYVVLRKQGFDCGCFSCFPDAYCVHIDGEGRRCRELLCRSYDSAGSKLCYGHWRESTRQGEMLTLSQIVKSASGPGVGPEVKP